MKSKSNNSILHNIVYGISNTQNLINNAIELNKFFKINLSFNKKANILYNNKTVTIKTFDYFDSNKDLRFNLISNKQSDIILLESIKKIDYLFIVSSNEEISELNINCCENITLLKINFKLKKEIDIVNHLLYQLWI